ncbi:hypothetical protein BDW75DRAFT_250120 [Aspergillus navahoensis]
MLLTGLGDEVQWGKELQEIVYSPDGTTVTARFTDGTADTGSILVATDGPHSQVRTLAGLRGEGACRSDRLCLDHVLHQARPLPPIAAAPSSLPEHVLHQEELAKHFADTWRSVFECMNWDPSLRHHRRDNQGERVTLAGDASDPMTFQRGQGLNHAIMDAYTVCKATESFWDEMTSSSSINTGDQTDIETVANAVTFHLRSMRDPTYKRGFNFQPVNLEI